MRLDIQAIKDAADITVVAEELGLEIQTRGTNKSILCPKHDDQHFGSCFLRPSGYKCYACGAHGDVFQLVQDVQNVSFPEAVRIVAEICGGEEFFEGDAGEDAHEYTSHGFLSRSQQMLLGIRNEAVWTCKEIIEDEEDTDDTANARPCLQADGSYDGCVVLKRVDSNPLYTLFKQDNEAYHDLVEQFCANKIEEYRHTLEIFRAEPATIQNQHLRTLVERAHMTISDDELTMFFSNAIKEIQLISLTHGTGACAGMQTADEGDGKPVEKEVRPMDSDLISSIQVQIWQNASVPF